MVQQETFLQIVDNSGIKNVKCINILGGSKKSHGYVGDVISASIQELRHNRSKKLDLKKGDLVFCLIVHSKFSLNRSNGQRFKFLKNCAILVDKNKKPIATRVSSPIFKDFQKKNLLKVLSLSSLVL